MLELHGRGESPTLQEVLRQQDERDRAEGEAMLTALIGHWQALGNTSAGALREGFLNRPGRLEDTGKGLGEVCEAVGMPPVLHMGSCVDNSRILVALCEMVNEGGIGKELCELPIAGAAPEAMCEKAIAIGFYCVASGAYVNYAPAMRVTGAPASRWATMASAARSARIVSIACSNVLRGVT